MIEGSHLVRSYEMKTTRNRRLCQFDFYSKVKAIENKLFKDFLQKNI